MLFQDLTGSTNAELLKSPQEYLLFAFDPPVTPVRFDTGNIAEPGFTGGKVMTIKHSPPYRMAMGAATKLLFDGASTSMGVLMMIRPSERIGVRWSGVAGEVIRYDLPPNTIILRNTSGTLRKTAGGGNPATCQKRFYSGSLRCIVDSGSADAGTVQSEFEADGFKTFNLTHLNKVWLQSRGFVDAYGNVAFRLAFVPAGVARANVVKLYPNVNTVDAGPVNSIKFTFYEPAAEDCKIIAEYSSPEGWKPLSFIDSTAGCTRSGIMHFEPPADWQVSSRWDDVTDIGGGAPGSGLRARWIRLQRRGGAGAGPTLALAPQTYNAPYALATRSGNPLRLDYTSGNVGQEVIFRFTPVDQDGVEDFSASSYFHYTIKGTALE